MSGGSERIGIRSILRTRGASTKQHTYSKNSNFVIVITQIRCWPK
jgi:hypothetical protein